MADRDSGPLNLLFFFWREGGRGGGGTYGYQIWIFECLYSYRDHLPETLGKTVRHRTQKVLHPRLTPLTESKTSLLELPNNREL